MFYNPCVIEELPLHEVDPLDERNFLPMHQMWLGDAMSHLFQREDIMQRPDMVYDIRIKCRNFLVCACVEVKHRFPLNDQLWKLAALLNPTKALDDNNLWLQTLSFLKLVKEVPCIFNGDLNTLTDEWRWLSWHNFDEDLYRSSIVDFYQKIGEVKELDGTYKFRMLSNFALHILSLPISNADTERLFSRLSLIKTKSQNALQLPTLKHLIILLEYVHQKGGLKNV